MYCPTLANRFVEKHGCQAYTVDREPQKQTSKIVSDLDLSNVYGLLPKSVFQEEIITVGTIPMHASGQERIYEPNFRNNSPKSSDMEV